MTAAGPRGAASVADGQWATVRQIAGEIERLEALDRGEGLDEDGRAVLARLRIRAGRASSRAVLADDVADRIDRATRTRDRGGGATGT